MEDVRIEHELAIEDDDEREPQHAFMRQRRFAFFFGVMTLACAIGVGGFVTAATRADKRTVVGEDAPRRPQPRIEIEVGAIEWSSGAVATLTAEKSENSGPAEFKKRTHAVTPVKLVSLKRQRR